MSYEDLMEMVMANKARSLKLNMAIVSKTQRSRPPESVKNGWYVSFRPGEEHQYDFMDMVYAMTEPVDQLPLMLRNYDANLLMDAPNNIIVKERLKRGY